MVKAGNGREAINFHFVFCRADSRRGLRRRSYADGRCLKKMLELYNGHNERQLLTMSFEFEICNGYDWIKLSNFKFHARNQGNQIGFGNDIHFVQGMDKSSGEETTSSCCSCCSSAMASRISSCNAFTSFRRSSLLVLDKDAAGMVGVTC
jgi:hypothetical protein